MPAESACLFADWPLDQEPAPSTPDAAKPRSAPPRFQVIDRKQMFFRTVDVEALIPEDHAARAIWKVVNQLDLSAFSEPAPSRAWRDARRSTPDC